jgi:hypothetical protein
MGRAMASQARVTISDHTALRRVEVGQVGGRLEDRELVGVRRQ